MDYPIDTVTLHEGIPVAVPVKPHQLCWVEQDFYNYLIEALEQNREKLLIVVQLLGREDISRVEIHAERKPIDIVWERKPS